MAEATWPASLTCRRIAGNRPPRILRTLTPPAFGTLAARLTPIACTPHAARKKMLENNLLEVQHEATESGSTRTSRTAIVADTFIARRWTWFAMKSATDAGTRLAQTRVGGRCGAGPRSGLSIWDATARRESIHGGDSAVRADPFPA